MDLMNFFDLIDVSYIDECARLTIVGCESVISHDAEVLTELKV